MKERSFTLGECNRGDNYYRFDYENGKYAIYTDVTEEWTDPKLVQSFTKAEQAAAYNEWNKIKRPEKSK